MRALGVDLGSRRIGLAISDPDAHFAFPIPAIQSAGLRRDVAAIRKLVDEREIDRIVVGLPLHMNGTEGPEAEAARCFAASLARATGRVVETLDERWTTVEAERALRTSGNRRQRQKRRKSGERDSMAAAIILRTWLERAASRAREDASSA